MARDMKLEERTLRDVRGSVAPPWTADEHSGDNQTIMRPDEEDRSTAEQRLVRFFAQRPVLGLVSVYLFGSHAEDRPHRESDVDVAILLDRRRCQTTRERFEVRNYIP